MKRILTAIIILASVFVTTCDNIALGTALNLKGPVVEIAGPLSLPGQTDPEVSTLFDFWGTASSDSTVTRMTVTLTYFNRAANKMILMGREWKWEGGSWQTREGSNRSWRRYTKDVYQSDYENFKDKISNPSWSVSGKTVNWKLPIYMNRMEKGQYFVTVTAWDNVGNSDSNSSKRIKVEFSDDTPSLKVDLPLLIEGGGALDAPTPPNFSGPEFKFDPLGNPRQTYENRSNFTNKFPDFRWTIDHAATLSKLTLSVTNEHNLDITDIRKKTYYYGEFENIAWETSGSNRTTKGNHIDTGTTGDNNGTPYRKVGNAITLSQSAFLDDINALPNDRITPLQIVSTIEDINSLKEYKSKGWILWLPDSDKPFVDITFGYKVKDGQTPPADACEQAVITRGTKNNRLNFYDDKEGLASAEILLFKLKDNSFETETTFDPVKISFSDRPTSVSSNFIADYAYGIGRYRIEIQARDYGTSGLNGIYGDKYVAYFTIVSNSAPEILDWPSELALADGGRHADTIWGNNSGTFTFWGRAAIEGDELGTVKVNRVTVVMLNYEQGDQIGAANELRYIDPSFSGWNLARSSGFATDSNNNKIWEIPATAITLIPGTEHNKGDGDREEYKFTKDFNWFTDLNGNTSTSDKRFIVRALSVGALNREYYNTKTITIHGDTTTPFVDVQKLQIQFQNDSGAWVDAPVPSYTLHGLEDMLPAITKKTRIKLTGTWNDDSASKWTTIQGRPRSLFKNISIRWEGTQRQYPLYSTATTTITNPSGSVPGTWETGWFDGFPDAGNADPIVNLIAIFEDLGGNPGRDMKSVVIETDTPTLMRVSSNDPNGSYGTGKTVTVFLDFNKQIFLDITAGDLSTDNLYLTLSNGARAVYKSGLGKLKMSGGTAVIEPTPVASEKIVFTYTIAAGDNETNGQKLNVTSINYGACLPTRWRSNKGSQVVFRPEIFTATNVMSLAGQKTIIIDKTPPRLNGITTSAVSGRTYGKGQSIAFTVNFSENIDLLSGINGTNTYLVLAGGNLVGKRAPYYAKAGADSIQFVYDIANSDDSGSNIISVTGIVGFANIMDKAGNPATAESTTIGSYGTLAGKQVKIDTISPDKPVITGITSGATYYGDVEYTITGLEAGGRVEYNNGYTTGATTGWTSESIGSSTTKKITLSKNGTYNVAARQFDTAMPENVSEISTVITNIKIDSGAILTKITSTNSSGNYGYDQAGVKNQINITLEFRIPVWISGSNGTNAWITINTTGGGTNANRVNLPASGVGTNGITKLSLTYTIPSGANTSGENLNVTALNFVTTSGIDVRDAATGGQSLLSWISLDGTYGVSADNQLNRQKEIVIIADRPAMINSNLGTSSNGTQGTWFNGTQLGIKFNRDIYRGTTGEKLIIRQVNADFRIPAVLSEQKWSDIFSGREDMFNDQGNLVNSLLTGANSTAKANLWRQLGEWLYEKGSNGATLNGNALNSDTSTKYVLRFSVNTINNAANNITGITGVSGLTSISMSNLADLFRAAEALTFGVNDPSISTSTNTLTVALSGARALPVAGATYEWIFPNGFVIDTLNKPNGSPTSDSAPTGTDTAISSSANTRLLVYTQNGTGLSSIKTEIPVIRIDKGGDETYFNNARDDLSNITNTRQARQKLQADVKMESRTPGATISYRQGSASDDIGALIMRTSPGNRPNYLPNLGRANSQAAWEEVRLRPQSGGGSWTATTGLNHYTSIANNWRTSGSATDYSGSFKIGDDNYSSGGQTFYFQARTRATNMTESDYGYEAAYRSVFIYNHANINGNGTNDNINGQTNTDLSNAANRIWIRGSNTAQGEPTIPDFPLSRNPTLYKKIKLLTPITLPNNYSATTELKDSDINAGATASSRSLWFWVTWKVNVNTFVDLQTGYLPTAATTNGTAKGIHAPVSNIRKFYMAFIPSNEHYAVLPGRTTVVETRGVYGNQWDGDHGALDVTSQSNASAATDLN